MQDAAREYVRIINRSHLRTGTLREGRFKSSLVDSDRYCLACYRYLELNPVRAGMVRHSADYPWSSYPCNTLGKTQTSITPHDCWLLLGEDDTARTEAYQALFKEASSETDIKHIRHCIKTGLPTGNDRFRREIETVLSVRVGHGKRGRPRKTRNP
jgi:putative transposase